MIGRLWDTVKNLDDKRLQHPSSDLKDIKLEYEYDVFISYATNDQEEANKIYLELSRKGLKCFLSGKTLKTGDKFTEEIRKALLKSREVCYLFTPKSKTNLWTSLELGAAWVLGKRIVPINHRIDFTELADLPGMLAFYQGKDFSDLRTYVNEVKKRKESG